MMFETTITELMNRLSVVSDMPYWSLNIFGEDATMAGDEIAHWGSNRRWFVAPDEKSDFIRSVYCTWYEPATFTVHWACFRGDVWYRQDKYLDYSWPVEMTATCWGTWIKNRYFNITEACGYDDVNFIDELSWDLNNLKKVICCVQVTNPVPLPFIGK